jgi:Beta-lactamase
MTTLTPVTLPNAADSDPRALGWMTGFPPPPEKAVTFADGSFRKFPQLRWAWSNIRQLVPTVGVWRGPGPASVLPRSELGLGNVKLTTMDGRPITFDQALAETYADGIVVLHRGRIVFERYFGVLEPHKQHIAMSVTKSFTGVLAGILVAEGKLDPAAPVTAYVPELEPSAFGDATVAQVMDMTSGLKYTEVYTDTNSDVWAMRRANGMAPPEPGTPPIALLEYLTTQQKQGDHGRVFAYKTSQHRRPRLDHPPRIGAVAFDAAFDPRLAANGRARGRALHRRSSRHRERRRRPQHDRARPRSIW